MHGKFSCFVIGEGTLPVLCAQELIKASSEILGIISPDPAVLQWAQANGVRGFSTAAIEVLRQTPYDYLFSIANRVILRDEILSTPRQYAINFHDAPLPKYAGVHATSWALMQREREHGITWHTMVADKIDGGEILKQVIIPVSPTETTLSLNAKCFGAGVKAFAEMIRELGTDQIRGRQQDFNQRSYFPASRRPTGAGILSWQMSGQDMEALVRALDFGGYDNTLSSAKLIVEDSWLVVDKLQALSAKSNAAAGTIIEIRDNALVVATSSCDLVIRQLRTIDGEKVSALDFATRFKLSPGHRFDDMRSDQRERVAVLAESLARYENAWRRRLHETTPLAIASARSGDAAAGAGMACHRGILRSSEIEAFLKAHDTWRVNDFLFAAYVIYLSCSSGKSDFCVGFGHRKLHDEIRGLESFFAYPVPWVLDVNGNKKITEAIDDIIARLESTKASRTYLRDLGARYQGASPTRLSIVVEEAGVAGASKGDFDLKFAVSESGDDCSWFYDSRLLSQKDVETIHDNFCNFLSALMLKTADAVNELPTLSHRRWLGAGPEGEDRRQPHQDPDKAEQRAILLDLKEKRISPAEARQKLESILRKGGAGGSGSSKTDVRSESARNQVPEPVAVVGISGRFPGARNIREFWENLQNGVDSVKEITKDRWDIDRNFDPEPGKAGKIYSRYAGFIDDIDRFDPSFFNMSPKEAEQMEPQYRLLLQETWRAIEDAGYKASSLSGKKVGVFVGASVGDYSGDNVQVPSLECSRIAYLFDWRGPCICIETACSSALVAVHEACMHIGTNQVEMAVVGGMNLMVTPNAYRYLSRTYALSAKGKCFSFDGRADGTIFSEGVCAIVLKPLSSALSDNDHIYGVIKGSGINYDGKTNGITAPSGKAQMELEAGIYRQFNIDPETITMFEAHGTGTTLGDPIEADAMNKAFRQFTRKKSFCALGSVKSNIGHTGFASGLVGMIKALLSLEHRQIPATIHYQAPNPAISFADSPFYINTALKDWAAAEPRVAAVSSFGFSGTNAHVVVEEGPARRAPKARAVHVAGSARMVPLSAKNRDRLREAARNLLMHLREDKTSRARIELTDLAYTLQVGREEMSSRVVFLVHSLDELIDDLAAFLDADDDRPRGERGTWCRGDVKKTADGLRLVKGDKHWRDQVRRWVQQGTLVKLAELWAKGVDVDWALLYPELADRTGNAPDDRRGPYRISLPTYPFAEERYWIDNTTLGAPASALPLSSLLHPLLHANTSDLSEQRFSSRFSGDEPFLNDHQVKGQKVLPGVAYLEMALAAVQRACGGGRANGAVDGGGRLDGIRLTNVVWARPISVRDEPAEVHIGLSPREDGGIAYEIYTHPPSSAEKAVVHSQGVAVLTAADQPSPLNLRALQAGLDGNALSPQACYAAFSAMGIDYGPAHRGLERIHVGEREVLAKLKLPACVTETKGQFSLHPSILDSALQATIGIGNSDVLLHRLAAERRSRPSLPFALESLEVMAPCQESMWAWIRSVGNLAADTGAASEMLQKVDIDLCDEQGNICVRLKGFSSRILKSAESESAEPIGTLLLRPTWEEKPASCAESPREYAQTHVFLCGFDRDLRGLPGDLAPTSFVNLDSAGTLQPTPLESSRPWYRRFEHCAVRLFEAIQEILRTQLKGEVLVQVLVPGGGRDRTFSAVSGLLKSAQLEHPRLVGQVIEVDGDESAPELIDRLRENARSPQDQRIRYEGGKRCVASLAAAVVPEVDNLPWRTGGVYWITGGAGGLGLIFATEIAERIRSGTLVLTGRSALSPERKAHLEALERLGSRVVYKTVDVSDRRAVEALVNEIKSESGGLQGVVHAAGVLRDNFIVKKTGAEFHEVLSPKVGGLVNVDDVTKELDLDFFVVFSSGAGEMGNVGQSDYATANAFMDAFADYRNALEEANQRTGRTLSINWPLWRDGGMKSDDASARMLREKVGITAMQTSSGMAAFYRCLASSEPRVMVVEGMLERMTRKLLPAERHVQPGPEAAPVTPSAAIETGDLLDKVQQNLIQVICEATKLRAGDLDVESELSEYGFDSISFTDLANRLNQRYGLGLTPTIFFEYSSIGSFAKYLVDEHRDAVARQFTISPQERSHEEAGESEVHADDGPRRDDGDGELEKHLGVSKRRARFANPAARPAPPAPPTVVPSLNGPQPFAVVGMSGKFPMAADLGEFWNNLRAGKDCIQEIPKQRWDWKAYFGDPLQGNDKTNIKWGGFIEGVDEFDPLFFGISHREAEIMDPQQRLLMTYIWLAMEDAGYSAASLSGSRTGIFVATASNGYDSLIFRSNRAVERYTATGMAPSIGPNRMSYFLNVHGPSEPIDTACSSSLVAMHRAIVAIEAGDCDQALVGGVNTLVTPDAYIRFNKEGMLSEDGRCKTFSSLANGYARGEGVGILFLKTLKAAEAAGDHIYGLIRASVENHGGRANSLTAPNPKAQAELLVRAYRKAGMDPRSVGYIEAHGTGTKLGDPIEIDALKNAFVELYRQSGDAAVAGPHCGIGSVKTNIGHLELASGVAGVIKVLLQFKHEMLVESLHCKEINPYIDLRGGPFYVVQEAKRWEALRDDAGKTLPRRAGVSSFGFGGANAHIVLEEYRATPSEGASVNGATVTEASEPAVVVLSGKSRDRLRDYAKNLLHFVRSDMGLGSKTSLEDLAYTLQVGRDAMDVRLGVVVHSKPELAQKLEEFIEGRDGTEGVYSGQVKKNKEIVTDSGADEDLREAVGKWMEGKEFAKVLELWVKGLNVDWNGLHGARRPRRISAPTYPFARECYWVEPRSASVADSAPSEIVLRADPPASLNSAGPPAGMGQLLCFEETWQPVTARPDARHRVAWTPRSVLCFLSDSAEQQHLRRYLEAKSPAIKTSFISTTVSSSGASWRVEPGNRDSFREAFQRVAGAAADVDAMLYLWPLENPAFIEDAAGIATILQSLNLAAIHPRRIVLAGEYSDGLQRSHLESWIGFERSIGLAWPDTRVTALIREQGGGDRADWWPMLWRELTKAETSSVLYEGQMPRELRIRPLAEELQTGAATR
ncbi:SDR family NAD(P)-dependent oxidoreductase [Pendulispora rubella]|uniref:SDR family NAD(P)-dependent oxidoreductase n=1 Tax=Pendulispora rubella TaxID=2741070 RepID=A0ABZ2KVF1_9BACT